MNTSTTFDNRANDRIAAEQGHPRRAIARTGIPAIIEQMRTERAGFIAEADKLGKAINLLKSL